MNQSPERCCYFVMTQHTVLLAVVFMLARSPTARMCSPRANMRGAWPESKHAESLCCFYWLLSEGASIHTHAALAPSREHLIRIICKMGRGICEPVFCSKDMGAGNHRFGGWLVKTARRAECQFSALGFRNHQRLTGSDVVIA